MVNSQLGISGAGTGESRTVYGRCVGFDSISSSLVRQ